MLRFHTAVKYALVVLTVTCALCNVFKGSTILSDGEYVSMQHLTVFNRTQWSIDYSSHYSSKSREASSLYRWRKTGLFDVDSGPFSRPERFPSVEDRVHFYMSSWFSSCATSYASYEMINSSTYIIKSLVPRTDKLIISAETVHEMTVSTSPNPDTLFIPENETLSACIVSHKKYSMRAAYCPEISDDVLPLYMATDSNVPLLIQVGDAFRTKQLYNPDGPRWMFPAIPHLKKFRNVWEDGYWDKTSDSEFGASSCQSRPTRQGLFLPIIWKLESNRHYVGLDDVAMLDTPWENKKNQSVFRGAISGKFNMSISDEYERCMALPRCRLVLTHASSQLVDANMTNFKQAQVSPEIRGIRIQGKRKTKRTLLGYKALIILEGNDVSTGLKWALLSSSVVLMPKPTVTSWLMEEWLQPYIHYVPLQEDLSDVDAQTRWVLEHDREARRIAERATLWMQDLLFHENSTAESELVNHMILDRYRALFRSKL